MIIIGQPINSDWPEFWEGWRETNILINGPKKGKYLDQILACINYRVCPKCGAEHAMIYEKIGEEDTFNCFSCSRIIKGENYNGKYTEVTIPLTA